MSASVTILDSDWPGRELAVMPGDLSKWLPQGLALGVPAIVTPYRGPAAPGYYAADEPTSDPIHAAPTQEPSGGVIYFNDGIDHEKLRATLGIIGVRTLAKDYAVFASSATSTEETIAWRYLDQVRILSKAALSHFFRATEAKELPEQILPIGDYIVSFIEAQRDKWGTGYSRELAGTLGDGDWAKESLAFGFAVENTYWGVYRLWSRPWVVTK